ncbi:MAG: FHA domain-containing protein [Planctomycetes bacterium]|nr:FHA domain-containing protein [Planctomycetota bacterium]MCB9908875.1 FHA domain-containing protein [Planctomycetota bacterium]HPF14277.1 FHA domain-containing protein [Planctomycetota bacterium]HRV81147.1 FHA domain-containing protein [Planctomycetota bacterium]
MTLWIYVLSGKELGRTESFDRSTVVVGRGDEVDLRLTEVTVSRQHARLRWHATGAVELEDLGSTAGTFLKGERVARCWLSDGDRIRLGDVELRVRVQMGAQQTNAAGTSPGKEAAADDEGLELELEGEWEAPQTRATAPKPAAGAYRPGSSSQPLSKPAASSSPKRKPSVPSKPTSAQLAGIPNKESRTTSGRRVLQYSQTADSGALGGDLAQRPAWQRTLALLLAATLMAGLAYGAYRLTQGVKASRSQVTQEP